MQAGEKSVAERGEEKMVQIVKDLDAAELSLRSVTDIRTKQMINGKNFAVGLPSYRGTHHNSHAESHPRCITRPFL